MMQSLNTTDEHHRTIRFIYVLYFYRINLHDHAIFLQLKKKMVLDMALYEIQTRGERKVMQQEMDECVNLKNGTITKITASIKSKYPLLVRPLKFL